MKYKVGDEICLIYKVLECDERSGWYRISENGYLSDDHIEKYASAKQPAPAPDGWEPKAGDRVLVEGVITRKSYPIGENFNGSADVEFPHIYAGQEYRNKLQVSLSSIVGPAPKRSRFRRDDRAFSLTENDFIDVQYEAEGGWYVIDANGDMVYATDSDLLTVCELRERLAK